MITIINRSQNNCIFVLNNNERFELKKDIPLVKTEEEYELFLKEYGCFFTPRIIRENNNLGCFEVIEDKKQNTLNCLKTDEAEEETDEAEAEEYKIDIYKLSFEELKDLAKTLNIPFTSNISHKNLIKKMEEFLKNV